MAVPGAEAVSQEGVLRYSASASRKKGLQDIRPLRSRNGLQVLPQPQQLPPSARTPKPQQLPRARPSARGHRPAAEHADYRDDRPVDVRGRGLHRTGCLQEGPTVSGEVQGETGSPEGQLPQNLQGAAEKSGRWRAVGQSELPHQDEPVLEDQGCFAAGTKERVQGERPLEFQPGEVMEAVERQEEPAIGAGAAWKDLQKGQPLLAVTLPPTSSVIVSPFHFLQTHSAGQMIARLDGI